MYGRLVLAVCLTAGCCAVKAAEGQLAGREAELDAVKSRIETLRRKLSEAETEKDAQASALRELEQQIGAITRRIHDLEREQGIRRRHLEQLDASRAGREAEVAAYGRLLQRAVRASFVLGRQERLKLLLNQEDPARVGRMLAYFDYLQRQRASQIRTVRTALERLDETRRTIATEEARLDRLISEEKEARVELERAQARREDVVANLDEDLRARGEEVSRLKQDEVRLKKLVQRLKLVKERLTALRDIRDEADLQAGPFTGQRGRLAWPVPGRLQASFGSAKGGGLSWDGVVISAPAGEEVRSVHGGRVVFSDWLKGYGLLMIVDHGDGYMSLYGYNQSLFKTAGDWVEAGEVVAVVGNSGGRTYPALYFGIRHNGKPVNPARWCQRASGRRVGRRGDPHWRFCDVA